MLEAGKALAAVGMSLVNTQADSLVSHHLLPRGWGRGLAGPAGWAACTLNLVPSPWQNPCIHLLMIGGQELMALKKTVSPTPAQELAAGWG